MIGSLWDLKPSINQTFDGFEFVYHDRFPMGFETFCHLDSILFRFCYHDRFPMGFETLLDHSLEKFSVYYHDRFPMGFETFLQSTSKICTGILS